MDNAIHAFKQAVDLNPGYVKAYFNLALASSTLGDHGAAVKYYEHCLRLNPDDAETHYNLANTRLKNNDIDAAIDAYKKAISLDPHHAQAFNNLAIALKKCTKLADAIKNLKRAIELKSDYAQAYHNLGILNLELKRSAQAIAAFLAYLQLQPDDATALNNLGNAYYQQGQVTEAISCYRKSLKLDPEDAHANYNLANALQAADKTDEALRLYQYALRHKPKWPEAYNNLGTAYQDMGLLDRAIAAFEQALEIQPDYAEAFNNLGIVYRQQGRIQKALSCYRRALQIKPDYSECHSNLVFGLNYDPQATQEEIFSHACQWWVRHGQPLTGRFMHTNSRNPNRRLKIGYVSADFRRHPVGFFLLPLLKEHDQDRFEVYCYSDIKQSDELTDQIKSVANHWIPTLGLSDADVAQRIFSDQIDILIDLAGHTAHNRLPVFARKPAPLQINWLGYVNTTGLGAMDFRVSDDLVDPPSDGNRFHSETLIRLENGFFCFAPPLKPPPVSELPARKRGHITFGSFNKLSKINKDVIALWSQIMQRLPGSRLRLMAKPLADASTRDRYLALFHANGIAADRLEMVTYQPTYFDYLNQYSQIDIGLDPYPHNGHTTTCDSLWMGVPVITMRGDRYASRMGASILTRLQLEKFVANSKEAYFESATGLATDLDMLQELRRGMRKRFASSPFYDVKRFAGEIESAYRQIWCTWCQDGTKP
ncbi:MAG: tetratricopeptide repeat protein [Deltaproteobacteria bacterium]|nr:tetratricopeptide repeat protein [Deltaproteobacteria bacterium]